MERPNVKTKFKYLYELNVYTYDDIIKRTKLDPNVREYVDNGFWDQRALLNLWDVLGDDAAIRKHMIEWSTTEPEMALAVNRLLVKGNLSKPTLSMATYDELKNDMIFGNYSDIMVMSKNNSTAKALLKLDSFWDARLEMRLGYLAHNRPKLEQYRKRLLRRKQKQPETIKAIDRLLKISNNHTTFRTIPNSKHKNGERDKEAFLIIESIMQKTGDINQLLKKLTKIIRKGSLFVVFNRYDHTNKKLNEMIILRNTNIDAFEEYIKDSGNSSLNEYFLEFLYTKAKLVDVRLV